MLLPIGLFPALLFCTLKCVTAVPNILVFYLVSSSPQSSISRYDYLKAFTIKYQTAVEEGKAGGRLAAGLVMCPPQSL